MAGMNPAINRIDKDAEAYAGFNQSNQGYGAQAGQGYAPPQGGPQGYGAPQGYGSQQGTPEQLDQWYGQPAAGPAQTGRMTLDDVVIKALLLLGVTVAAAAASWMLVDNNPDLGMPIMLGGIFGSIALSFIIAFQKSISVPLILTYAVAQGAFVGAISLSVEIYEPGLVSTAILATLSTFVGVFLTWKIGLIRVTARSARIFSYIVIGYAFFQLANLGMSLIGGTSVYSMGGPLPIILSVVGVAMAAYMIAVNLESVERGLAAGVPQKYSWLMAHGLVASLIWLYIEILRLLAILNQR